MPPVPDSSVTTSIMVDGCTISTTLAGEAGAPGLLLLHGVPNAARMFDGVIPALSGSCRIVAPDLPGFGGSDPVENATFARLADIIEGLLDQLEVDETFIYLHDFGAPVGIEIAMRRPERVLGLVVQNGNAHESGLGPAWGQVRQFWSHPDAENTAAAFAHLTPEGTRAQYVANVPDDIAAQMDPGDWEEDWRVMSLPGRLALQQDLIRDYRRHVERFDQIAAYLRDKQPPALLLWGRHDPYFDIAEVQSWLDDLPRLEAHILDGPHLLLETHADICAELMSRFVRRELS